LPGQDKDSEYMVKFCARTLNADILLCPNVVGHYLGSLRYVIVRLLLKVTGRFTLRLVVFFLQDKCIVQECLQKSIPTNSRWLVSGLP